MNEWGIPDWHDPTAYGDTETWHEWRWRWEFIRRRDDYRADFDVVADYTLEHYRMVYADGALGVDPNDVLTPNDPRFRGMATVQQGDKYGYSGLWNPRFSELPSYAPDRHAGLVAFVTGEGERHFGEPVAGAGDGEILVRFNLDRPLAAQVKAAEHNLAIYQQMRHGKKLETRKHQGKWFTYLRVLDGKEAGASWSEIFDVVLKPTKGENKNPAQEAAGIWEAARTLMFNWPD
jgi:hypothetical protein